MSLITNKKASFNYEITEKIPAGIELFGFEVKSIRKGQGSLEGAYVAIRGGEAFLLNAFIPPFQPNNTPESYDPYRARRLLLNKEEIKKLGAIEAGKGLTIVPLSLYNSGRNLKLDIAIGRGKKAFDKRESIKRRETDREIRREFKDR